MSVFSIELRSVKPDASLWRSSPTEQSAMRQRRMVLRNAFCSRMPTEDLPAPSPATRMFSTSGPTSGVPAELSIRMPTSSLVGETLTSPTPMTEIRLFGPISEKGAYEPGATQITPSDLPSEETAEEICFLAPAHVLPSFASFP